MQRGWRLVPFMFSPAAGKRRYRNAFNLDKMGYASTIAVMMLLICLVLAMIQNRAFRSGKGD